MKLGLPLEAPRLLHLSTLWGG